LTRKKGDRNRYQLILTFFFTLFGGLLPGAWALDHGHSPILVLMPVGRFDPPIDPDTYYHEVWVRWPKQYEFTDNRLLSIWTGLDWRGGSIDLAFEHIPDKPFVEGGGEAIRSEWQSKGWKSLKDRGYFDSMKGKLGPLDVHVFAGSNGSVVRSALFLGLNERSSKVSVHSYRELESLSLGPGTASILSTTEGRDVLEVAKITQGRVLVVEYPPSGETFWSRAWLLNRTAWPNGLPEWVADPIPGLVPAEHLGELLMRPQRFAWKTPPSHWLGANRWLKSFQTIRPIWLWSTACLSVVVLLASSWFVGQERTSDVLASFLRLTLLVPAATVLAGNLARIAGLNGQLVWLGGVLLGLFGLNQWMAILFRPRLQGSAIQITAWISFVALLSCNTDYSIEGVAFQITRHNFPGLSFSALLASFAILSTGLSQRSKGRQGFSAVISLVMAASTYWGRFWWSDSSWILSTLWIMVGLSSWPIFRWERVALWVTASLALIESGRRGIAFFPYGLIPNLQRMGRVNVFSWFEALVAPSVVSVLTVGIALALFGNTYFHYRIRRQLKSITVERTLVLCASYAAMGSLVLPELIAVALYSIGTALTVGIESCIRSELKRPQED
jgi:hypothetical protein